MDTQTITKFPDTRMTMTVLPLKALTGLSEWGSLFHGSVRSGPRVSNKI